MKNTTRMDHSQYAMLGIREVCRMDLRCDICFRNYIVVWLLCSVYVHAVWIGMCHKHENKPMIFTLK